MGWILESEIWQKGGVSADIVKKIDKDFLRHGSREDLCDAILQLLDLLQQSLERERRLEQRITALENELRRLKGEKKSRNSSHPPDLISRYPGRR